MLPVTRFLSSLLFLTIASRGCPDYCCHGNRGAGPPLWDLKTTWSKDPYVIGALLLGVCLCVLECDHVYCRVLKTFLYLLHNNKTGLSWGIRAVTSQTLTTAREDKYNLERTMKVKHILISNIRLVMIYLQQNMMSVRKNRKVN